MSVEQITKIMFAGSIVLAMIFLLLMIIRRKQMRKACRIVIPVLLILLVVVNGAVYTFQNVINQHFSAVQVDDVALEEASQASKEITRELMEEGIVLLENKENTLPLQKDSKVNVFGMSSIGLIYGGAGSGASDESDNVTLQEGLSKAGFSVNDELTKFYENHKETKKKTNIFNLQGGDYNIKEPAVGEYKSSLMKSAKEFSDVALIVFSRCGGEGGDLPMDMEGYTNGDGGKHYLELQDCERALLDLVKENFGTVVVLINSSNAMELGFLEEEGVDAALWIGGPGSTGCEAIGEVLSGAVNPSGRLVDTYAYDLTSSPAYYNAGNFVYTSDGEETGYKYVEYAEGIYVGYRFYETRFIDNETGLCDEEAYKEVVQYPFGYGLSYSSFEKSIKSHEEKDDQILVEVEVKNTGNVAGKEVVELYATAPYTAGGVEKAQVELVAYGKTSLLEAGKSETITLSFSKEDLASYDYITNGCYVLDAGSYEIKLMENAHDFIDSFNYENASTILYNESNPRSSDMVAASNQFEDAAGEVIYVSRSDWEGTLPTERVDSKEATKEILYALNEENIGEIYVSELGEGQQVTTGVSNGLILADMVGVPFEDPAWDTLLDQLSLEDMSKLMGFGGFSTVELASIEKVATIEIDGPAGLNALTSSISGVQFPSEVVIASTFNRDLVEKLGETYADEATANGVVGLYAPGVNIHRTPFSGRNFEYYSEDPFLNGSLGAAMTIGCNKKGVYCYPKHFALNDQETNRSGVCVWSNEQAIREIYLKPFELIQKTGKMNALMSSYNRIGTVWAGGNKALLTNVLRKEWGFTGMVATDYANAKLMNADQALLAGGDLMLSTTGSIPSDKVVNSNAGQTALRNSAKHILYTVVNSRAYTDPVEMGFPYWLLIVAIVDVLWLVVLTFLTFSRKKMKITVE